MPLHLTFHLNLNFLLGQVHTCSDLVMGTLGFCDMFNFKFDMDSIVMFEGKKFFAQTVFIGILRGKFSCLTKYISRPFKIVLGFGQFVTSLYSQC